MCVCVYMCMYTNYNILLTSNTITFEPCHISTPIEGGDLSFTYCVKYAFIMETSSSSPSSLSSSLLINLLAGVHLRGLGLLFAAFLSDVLRTSSHVSAPSTRNYYLICPYPKTQPLTGRVKLLLFLPSLIYYLLALKHIKRMCYWITYTLGNNAVLALRTYFWKISVIFYQDGSWNSVISTVTVLWTGWSVVRIPPGTKNLFLFLNVQTSYETHPFSYSRRIGGFFMGKSAVAWCWPLSFHCEN
jgi:hypothetical protein